MFTVSQPFHGWFSVVHFHKHALIHCYVPRPLKSTGNAASVWPLPLRRSQSDRGWGTQSISSYMQPSIISAGIETGMVC